MTRCIILSDLSGNWHRPAISLGDPVRPRDPAGGCEPRIETVTIETTDMDDVVAQPGFLAMAPVVATRLVASEPIDGLRDDETMAEWGIEAVRADRSPWTGAGARIALLDTGIAHRHPAFAGVTVEEQDMVGTGIEDANGHGTHLAGTILGRDVEGVRIGVARGVETLYVAKAIPDGGEGCSVGFLRAFLWALSLKPHVIGFSLCFDASAEIERLAAEGFPLGLAASAAVHAYRGNLRIFEMMMRMTAGDGAPLVLGAAGDDSLRMIAPGFQTGPVAPASARGALPVGALMRDRWLLRPPPFSNLGPALSAPGAGIVSAGAGGWLRVQHGSAMALAHAMGVAALWVEALESQGDATDAAALADVLGRSARRTGFTTDCSPVNVGRGLVQAPL